MPNEFSNFSSKDSGSASGGYRGGAQENDYVVDPQTGQLVRRTSGNATEGTVVKDPRAWGGQGNSVDANGHPIYGTSGASQDIERYNDMANRPVHQAAPTLDATQANEARGLHMGSLGLLRDRAMGAQTPAQALLRQQTQGAVFGLQSGAASIKGGAGARAAAARGATATGARIAAQGEQDVQALRAREMADGAGQYYGAASAMRGADTTQAAENAKLEAGHRAAADQRTQHYQDKAWDVSNAENDAQLGVSAQDSAAAASARAARAQQAATDRQTASTVASTVTGAASGGIQAYANTRQQPPPYDPNDPNRTGSDERTKRNVKPISDKEAASLKAKGEGMLTGIKEQTAALSPREKLRSNAEQYDGKYLPEPFPHANPTPPEVLDEVLARETAGATPYARDNGSLFGARPGETAERGYAQGREGQAGYMFGGAPEASYAPLVDHFAGQAPGSEDYAFGQGHELSKADRDIAMSDPRAKRQAFLDGVNHSDSAHEKGEFGPVPDYMKEGSEKKSYDYKAALKRGADALVKHGGAVGPGKGPAGLDAVHSAQFGVTAGAGEKPLDSTAIVSDLKYQPQQAPAAAPVAPPPPPPAPVPSEPSYFDQVAGRMRTMTMSDERTKFGMHDSPMADANRAMEASSYEYKPEFTPPEQAPGEKNVGPMANKMAADPIAKTAIVEDPDTGLLGIDKTKGLKLALGGLSDLQRQIDALKTKRSA